MTDDTDEAILKAAKEAREKALGLVDEDTPPPEGDAQPQVTPPEAEPQDTSPDAPPAPGGDLNLAEKFGEYGDGAKAKKDAAPEMSELEQLRERVAQLEREKADAEQIARSATGRLKKTSEDGKAKESEELAQLRERNAQLEAELEELRSGRGEDDGLDPEIRKAAKRLIDAEVAPIKQRNEQYEQALQQQAAALAMQQQAAFQTSVKAAIPDIEDILRNPKWNEFRDEIEPISGQPYGALARDAFKSLNLQRLAPIVNIFKQSQNIPVLQNPKVRAQMRPESHKSPTVPAEDVSNKVYTRAELRALQIQVDADPAYLKTPDGAKRYAELMQARREGRVV